MSPRPYQLGQRQAATAQTRIRIINAARELLIASDGFSGFSIEMIARRADVARMTVYHQFGSKSGLLEALCDSLAASGGMDQIATAFRQPEPLEALNHYILVFSRFWEVDRLVMRRLRALAALDPDFEQVIRARDEWRRRGVRAITQRLAEQHMLSPTEPLDETVDILFTLISFETFDTLAGSTRSIEEVAPLVSRLAQAALNLKESQSTT
jgi:AcrR family transcriptional regulator